MANVQPNKFRFTFNIRGIEEVEIKNAPKGWEETTITYKRSEKYRGILKSLSLPFAFLFKGAALLRREFYMYGMLASVKMDVDKLNTSTYQYKNIYAGKADFTAFEDELKQVSIPFTQDDISIKISSNSGIKYQIPLDVPEAIPVLLTPLPLKEKADFIFTTAEPGIINDAYTPLSVVNNEQHALIASVQSTPYRKDISPNFGTNPDWFYNAQVAGNVSISGRVKGQVVSGGNLIRLGIYSSVSGLSKTIYEYTAGTLVGHPFEETFNFVIPVAYAERLLMYIDVVGGTAGGAVGMEITEGELNLSYYTETAATDCKALRGVYVYDKLIQLMNGQNTGGAYTPYPTRSNLLTGMLNKVVFTCSNAIRQIPNGTQILPGDPLSFGSKYRVVNGSILYGIVTYTEGQQFTATEIETFSSSFDGSVVLVSFAEYLQFTFDEFFQTIYSFMGGDCSFGLDMGVACMENLSYVYRSGLQIMNVGKSAKNVKVTPAIDQLFGSIKVGYEPQQYDTLNGSQAVNSIQQYSSVLPIKKELNLVSPTITEAYFIEQIRITPVDTAASRSDNNNIALWIKDTMDGDYYQPLRGEGLISITGVDAGTAYYNWILSPKRNLLRGGRYLASIFYGLQGYKIKFETADKNFNLVTVGLDGVRVAERDDISITNLPAPIFMPYKAEITTDIDANAMDFLEGRAYGYIGFDFRGYNLKGFITEVSVDAAQNSQRDYTLLLTPDNNLINLIDKPVKVLTKG